MGRQQAAPSTGGQGPSTTCHHHDMTDQVDAQHVIDRLARVIADLHVRIAVLEAMLAGRDTAPTGTVGAVGNVEPD